MISDSIARAFKTSGTIRTVALDISTALGFGILVFFTNLSLMEFQVRFLALFLLFSVIDGFEWSWIQEHPRMLEFLKAPFLVLYFSYYQLVTFLTMLSVILLSVLMILLSILSVTRHLICGNNLN